MIGNSKIHTFLYNGAKPSNGPIDGIILDYRPVPSRNVIFKIPKLVEAVGHIPNRYLDLLELASYVFCADRYVSRGSLDSPYFSGWHRSFKHIIAVRDYKFWSDPNVHSLLESLLSFMSGDEHSFEFYPGHSTPKVDMFDGPDFYPPTTKEIQVVMFSGGLDSTSGVVDLLTNSQSNLILASHVSQTGSKKTQRCIAAELERRFPRRVSYLMFECHLSGKRACEETQRTRSFLYTAVGAAIARAYHQRRILFFENGILSINLPPSEQYQNARATRTTHPRVLSDLTRLLTLVEGSDFLVSNGFFWMTKADIVTLMEKNGCQDLLNSTVSCSRTFDKGIKHSHTHCGRCSQCIDRRFAIASTGLLDEENRGLYAYDFVIDDICPDSKDKFGREERTLLIDYVRLAMQLRKQNIDSFEDEWLDHLTDIVDVIDTSTETEAIEKLHKLFVCYGNQVMNGILAFQREYADKMFGEKHQPNSLAEILSTQEYLEPPARLFAERIAKLITEAIPLAFKTHPPSSEKEVQDHVESLMKGYSEELSREFPHVNFALGSTVPDFSLSVPCVYIEVKYLRGKTTPSKASAGIAEDCTKYPKEAFLLFILYDPERQIKDDKAFADSFEQKRACLIRLVR